MMANDLSILFNHFNQVVLTSERKYLPEANRFESYDDKKYWKCKTKGTGWLKELSVKLHITSPTLICVLKLYNFIQSQFRIEWWIAAITGCKQLIDVTSFC